MKDRIRAVFFDIDGTLVSFKTHAVPQSTKDAIKQLRANGVKVFVATGRMLAMTSVLNDIDFDGFVTYNGAFCTNHQGEVVFKSTIPVDELNALVRLLKVDNFPVSFMCRNDMFVNFMAPVVREVSDLVHVAPPVVRDVEEIIKEDVFQLCIYVDDDKLKYIIENALPNCEGSRWIDVFADVNLKGMSKSVGIDAMLRHYGIPLSESMAFGDGGNDITMLEHVALGVAMGDANDVVKGAADYVTGSVDDNGVVNALKHFNML